MDSGNRDCERTTPQPACPVCGGKLIEIRAKVTTQRLLEPLSDQARLMIKVLVVGIVPLAIAVFGVFRQVRRRREEARFLAAQGGPHA